MYVFITCYLAARTGNLIIFVYKKLGHITASNCLSSDSRKSCKVFTKAA